MSRHTGRKARNAAIRRWGNDLGEIVSEGGSQLHRLDKQTTAVGEVKLRAILRERERLKQMGRPRQLVRDGQWVDGCTAERPKGWEGMGIREADYV